MVSHYSLLSRYCYHLNCPHPAVGSSSKSGLICNWNKMDLRLTRPLAKSQYSFVMNFKYTYYICSKMISWWKGNIYQMELIFFSLIFVCMKICIGEQLVTGCVSDDAPVICWSIRVYTVFCHAVRPYFLGCCTFTRYSAISLKVVLLFLKSQEYK